MGFDIRDTFKNIFTIDMRPAINVDLSGGMPVKDRSMVVNMDCALNIALLIELNQEHNLV